MSDSAHWSRRNFLSARGLGASAGGALGVLIPQRAAQPAGFEKARLEVCYARRAMACEFNIFLPPTTPQGMAAANAALDEIQQMDELLTVYAADSLMSYVNQNAYPGPVRTDTRIIRLIQRAAELTAITEGALDIAAGTLVKAWGFYASPRRVPDEAELHDALARSGMRHVELDAVNQTVRYRVQGVEINLGAIGKGYAIDQAIDRICKEYGVESALLQGGLSSMYALGAPSEDEEGWLVAIQSPFDPTRPVATVRLRDRALGTSATNRQYFEAGGQRYGHILVPRTGRPARTDLASATVLAADAATADALSTAFYVMGLDKVRIFCHNHPEIAALLVLQHGNVNGTPASPQVVTFNLTKKDCPLAG